MSEMDIEDKDYKAKQLRFEYSTDDLIAELERRRPCKRCEHWRHNATPCKTCFWKGLWNMGEALHTDNFKEAA